MTIVRCPRCRDEVTVPAKATSRALVRCPLCLEEYLLAEALANAPPSLVIIGGEVEQSAIQAPAESDSEYRLAGGFSHAAETAAASAVAPRPVVRGPSRPRRQERSSLILVVNYVVGGVLGLALGLLVLWWGFRKDPLELGPKVARYLPRIVPEEFRGAADRNGDNAVANGTAKSAGGAAKSKTSKAGAKAPPTVALPKEPTPELQTLPDETLTQPTATPTPTIDVPDVKKRGAADKKKRNNESKTEAAPVATSAPPPMPDLTDLLPEGPFVVAPVAGPPAEEEKPVASATGFAQAVDEAAEDLRQYEQLPREAAEPARQAFRELHAAVGEVGRAISYLNPSDADLAEPVAKVHTLLDSLAGATGRSRVNAIKFLTLQRWPEVLSDHGLVAAGTVKSFRAAGPLFEVTLDAGVRDSPLTLPLVTRNNPQDLCKVGDEIVAIGRVVDDPKQSLAGYQGDKPRVLFVGFAVRAAKPQ